MAELLTFQRFTKKERAEELIALLAKNDLVSVLEDNTSSLGDSFGTSYDAEFAVKLRAEDFEKANQVLIEDTVSDLDAIDKDYYLFSFSDVELRDVVAHRDEWNAFDFLLAQKLLKDRGHEIDQDELDQLKRERLAELSKPEPRQTGAIIAGYVMAFLGGLLGIVIGWYLSTYKRTLPNGDRVYHYGEDDRKHGKRILYLGIFFVVFWNLFWLLKWHETFLA